MEYIESTGTQWIYTRWAPPIDGGIEFDIQLTENENTRQNGTGSSLFLTVNSDVDEEYKFGANIGDTKLEYNKIFYWVEKKYSNGSTIYTEKKLNLYFYN